MRVPVSRLARMCAVGAAALSVAVVSACAPHPPPDAGTPVTGALAPSAPDTTRPAPTTPEVVPIADFHAVSDLVNEAVAAGRLPGAVVLIGHAGDVVFREAFGARKLDGEPGLGGAPAPAEPMTTDILFDLASLTKSLATTTAVLQLYEQGRFGLDDTVQTYFPEFNPQDDPRRAAVTLRMLLTHTSGIAGDLSLDGPWGLQRADKAEGIRRALAAWVVFEPGALFHYSDINFIILGALVEKLTGAPLDHYVPEQVFAPLGLADTHYLPAAKACGPYETRGAALAFDADHNDSEKCAADSWDTDLLARVAPTALDEDTPGLNPHYGQPLRGTVHDPTARRMGGVTGSAGVFSTVHDVGIFAQALLDRLAGRESRFPLQQSTVALMTTPQPAGPDLRGLGWDIDTAHSGPRGAIFPAGSFGHTGFTGTTLWLDPGSDTYIVVLANVIHLRGGPPIAPLSGAIATATAQALHLYGS